MTTYNWSALTNNQIVPFVPGADVLHFDDPTLSAADLSWTFGDTNNATDPNGNFTLNVGGKTVKFGITTTTPAPFASITTSNVTFANGSQFIVGDNLISLANDNLPNTLTGGNGNDALFGLGGNDTMTGGLGNDDFWVAFSSAGIGNDLINGGDGIDSLIYNVSSTVGTTVNLSGVFNVVAAHTATNAQGTATLTSIENVFGTAAVDNFIGGDPAHGIDSLGNRIGERFRGNNGNDTITGGIGDNFFTTADYANNTAGQAINANLLSGTASDGRGFTDTLVNVDALRGGDGNDTMVGGSQSRGTGGTFFELFRGNAGNDRLDGNNANTDGVYASTDRADYSNNTSSQAVNVNLATGVGLDGLGGTDTLIDIDEVYAGAGNDTLTGGSGRDALDGGAGNDILNGGADLDAAHFVQSTAGVIVNLSATSLTVSAIIVAPGTANDGMGGTDTLINIEAVRASDFADHIRGSDLAHREVFRGDAGNDTIDGGGGTEDFVSYSDVPAVLGALNATLANGTATISDRKGGTDTLTNIEGLGGTHGNDTLTGGAGDQWFSGNGGSDLIDGGIGSDWVTYFGAPSGVTVTFGVSGTATDGYNGLTNKLLLGGTDTFINIENAEGSDFNDVITGGFGDNILRGRAGNDALSGGLGSDTADYTAATSGVLAELWRSLASNDGQGGSDTLISIENLTGSGFNDVLAGDDNSNVFKGGVGVDALYGGGGIDTADYSAATGGVFVELWKFFATNDGQGAADTLVDIENLTGSAFADILAGDNANNVFKGGAGNDAIFGGGGSDTADYSGATGGVFAELWRQSASNDGQGGADVLVDLENLTGSAFADTFAGDNNNNVFKGGAGVDALFGGGGSDTADYSGAGSGVFVELWKFFASNDGQGGADTLVDIENVNGSAFADTFAGDNNNNVFKGGAGVDAIFGGGGIDTADYSGAASGTFVELWRFFASNDGQGGADTLVDIENLTGSAFNDTFAGDNNNNVFKGGAGVDALFGGGGIDTISYADASSGVHVELWQFFASNDGQGGADTLVDMENVTGSAFADVLAGDNNANRLEGAGGTDVLYGGGGADSYAYGAGSGVDYIGDFIKAQGDKIHLQSNLNGSGITTGALALAHTSTIGGNAVVDLGGGNSVTLVGVTAATLAASDFLIF